jgi:uncharacterized protein (TIGR03435 family)
MQQTDASKLLLDYAENASEEAFAALVKQYVHLVYSVALRQVGDPHQADEITQVTFIVLAKKAMQLRHEKALSTWLFQTARLIAKNSVRSEMRRHQREQEAYRQSVLQESSGDIWLRIAPKLDAAVGALGEKDRRAIILRFYEGKNMREIGAALGASEDAVEKRVLRALEKLRRFFSKHGVSSTTAALAGTLSANSVHAAPAGLITKVTAMAITKGTTAGGSTLALIKGALKFMFWTKAKVAVAIGAGVVLTAATDVAVNEVKNHKPLPWQVHEGLITEDQLNQPPQVRILPSTFHQPDTYMGSTLLGTGVRAQDVVANAYGSPTPARVIFHAALPTNRFDYIACLPGGILVNEKALQEEVKRTFGVVGKSQTRVAAVWLLKAISAHAPGLKLNLSGDKGNSFGLTPNGFRGWNEPTSGLAMGLESAANVPVNDETGLTNRFDFDLNCSQTDLEKTNWASINEALGQLGLQLVPTNLPTEVVVVEKAKFKSKP